MINQFRLGLVATLIWLTLVTAIALLDLDRLLAMEANQWGDFLAGIMEPPAFMWFILAYMQQSRELRLNTKALELQQKELQHQVEETRALVKQTEIQALAS